jgi:hypothetical protein
MGVPVRTSIGAPRYGTKYPLVHALPTLYPDRAWLRLERPAYTKLYVARLDAAGVARIAAECQAVADQAGEETLVLLCFEDLGKPDLWCHRRIFAEWWTQNTGEPVPELGRDAERDALPLGR